jgi:predicted lipid carrier protein YhbT
MRIKRFGQLLQKNCPENSVLDRNISDHRNRVLAVDANCYLKRFVKAPITDLHFDFLVQVFQKTVRLIRHGIKPVFVFDGEVNEAKVSGDIAYIFSLSRALSIFVIF